MIQVAIESLPAELQELVQRALAGEDVVLTSNGEPVARFHRIVKRLPARDPDARTTPPEADDEAVSNLEHYEP